MASRAARNAQRRQEQAEEALDPSKTFHQEVDPRAHAEITEGGAYVLTTEGCTCPGPYTIDTSCPYHGDRDDD